jgi:hypothetical protein
VAARDERAGSLAEPGSDSFVLNVKGGNRCEDRFRFMLDSHGRLRRE